MGRMGLMKCECILRPNPDGPALSSALNESKAMAVDVETKALQDSIFLSKVRRARAMSLGEKLALGPILFDEGMAIMRGAIRSGHPEFTESEVEREDRRQYVSVFSCHPAVVAMLKQCVCLSLVFAVAVFPSWLFAGEPVGVIVDDGAATATGTWKKSTISKPFFAEGYSTAHGGSGATMSYRVSIKQAGKHHVLMSYPAGGNRSAMTPVTIPTADGEQTVVVNQKKDPVGPGGFHVLGEFQFDKTEFVITIGTEGTKDYIIADALRVLTADEFAAVQKDEKSILSDGLKNASKAKPEARTEAKPMAAIEPFARVAPATAPKRLTPEELDALLKKHGGEPKSAALANDETFLRRVYLDIVGRQPKPDERAAFFADGDDRRAKVVDRLLAQPEFGANWANYWSDVISTRVFEPELTFLNYSTFKKWLAEQFNSGAGWDEITYRIVTATGKVGDNPAATFIGFHSGDRSRLAGETTRVFLAVQIQCAECHDHKFIDMPRKTFHELAAFFARTEAKLPRNESDGIAVNSKADGEHKMPGKGGGTMVPTAFGLKQVELGTSDLERRQELARWIVSPENPYFARAFVNRLWARFVGKGFCEPVDEIGIAAKPELPEVHTALAEHFIASGFDQRSVIRLIAATQAYQQQPDDPTGRLRGDEVFDSLVAAIELPNAVGTKAKADGAFRFPVPPKSTRDLVNDAFGFDPSFSKEQIVRSLREAMFLMNNEQLQKQIDAKPDSGTMLGVLIAQEKDDAKAIGILFRRVLARDPTEREVAVSKRHIEKLNDRATAFEDLLWSLLNSAEFTTRK